MYSVLVAVAVRPLESVTRAVTVTVPDLYSMPVVRVDALALPMLGLVSMLYELIVEPYAPVAPFTVIFAWDLPKTYNPQPAMVALLLMGDTLTDDMLGLTLEGAVMVKL